MANPNNPPLQPLAFNTKLIRSTLQGALDESRGSSRPRAADVAATLSEVTNDIRWKEIANVNKIQKWFTNKVSTLQETTLLAWWKGDKNRHLSLWKTILKTESSLTTFLQSLDNVRLANCPKVPYKTSHVPFLAYKKWIQEQVKKDQNKKKKTEKQAQLDEEAAALQQQTLVQCNICNCSATRKVGGRMLMKITCCDNHKNNNHVSQLFTKDLQGRLNSTCSHCMIRCVRCGCTALRDTDMAIATHSSNTDSCRKAHKVNDVFFRANKSRLGQVGIDNAEGIVTTYKWTLVTTCKQCEQERALLKRQKDQTLHNVAKHHKKEEQLTTTVLKKPTTISTAFLSIPTDTRSRSCGTNDMKSISYYLKWKTMKTRSWERAQYLRRAGVECFLLNERVHFLFTTLFPLLEKRKVKEN